MGNHGIPKKIQLLASSDRMRSNRLISSCVLIDRTMSSNTPPESNPILSAYEAFVRETPLVTRYLLACQFLSWFLSFFFDFSYALANIPHFTVFKLELYRIVLSPLVCPNLLSLVLAYFSFVDNGRRLEFSMGSAAFGCLLATLGVTTNLIHIMISFMLFGMSGRKSYLFLPSIGIWTVLFGVIAMECSKAPQNSLRKLFFFTVPTIYYPVVLLVLFSLFGGFQVPYIVSIGVGYAIG